MGSFEVGVQEISSENTHQLTLTKNKWSEDLYDHVKKIPGPKTMSAINALFPNTVTEINSQRIQVLSPHF